jgi:hypothetical protein
MQAVLWNRIVQKKILRTEKVYQEKKNERTTDSRQESRYRIICWNSFEWQLHTLIENVNIIVKTNVNLTMVTMVTK